MKLRQHPRQLLTWHMKQHSVREHPIEPARWQFQVQQVLFPHFMARFARHFGEPRTAVQTDRGMTELGKSFQVASWTTAKVENGVRRRRLDIAQQRRDILADI